MTGRVSAEVVCRRLEVERQASTCPDCGRRPATVATTGLCVVCHRRALTEAHHQILEEIDAERALRSSRQALCRARAEVGT